jgi:hypothetical protein
VWTCGGAIESGNKHVSDHDHDHDKTLLVAYHSLAGLPTRGMISVQGYKHCF